MDNSDWSRISRNDRIHALVVSLMVEYQYDWSEINHSLIEFGLEFRYINFIGYYRVIDEERHLAFLLQSE